MTVKTIIRKPGSCANCAVGEYAVYLSVLKKNPKKIESLRRRSVTFSARSIILRDGDLPTEAFTIFEGWAFRFTLLPDGRRQILSYLLPGDLVTYQAFSGRPLRFSIQALTDISMCAFDLGEMRAFTDEDFSVSRQLGQLCCRETGYADLRITDLGRRTALERVASLILEIDSRLRLRGVDTNRPFDFPLRQEHIADSLGLTSVHVSRTLTTLRDDGIADIVRGIAMIRDRVRLEELTGFAYSAHRNPDGTA